MRLTGKIEKNLEQARFSIDMIDMLRSKTRGNISSELEKLLDPYQLTRGPGSR